MTKYTACSYPHCKRKNYALDRRMCAAHTAYNAARAAHRRDPSKPCPRPPPLVDKPKHDRPPPMPGLKEVQATYEVKSRPPWAETTVSAEWVAQCGTVSLVRREQPHPDRPDQWHEVVDVKRRRVVMRSLRPVDHLKRQLGPGQRVTICVRRRHGTDANPHRWWAP